MKLYRRVYVKYRLIFTPIIPIMLLCLFNFTACLYSQDTESPGVGMIKAISGKVWLCREGKKEEAEKAMELKKGDILEIEDQSSAMIVYFKDGKKDYYGQARRRFKTERQGYCPCRRAVHARHIAAQTIF